VVAVPRSEYDAWVASHRGIESPAP
jgi:hypothetical protein